MDRTSSDIIYMYVCMAILKCDSLPHYCKQRKIEILVTLAIMKSGQSQKKQKQDIDM